jgi:hypothetical protein
VNNFEAIFFFGKDEQLQTALVTFYLIVPSCVSIWHLLSLAVQLKLFGKFGNFGILNLAKKVPCKDRGHVNSPGRVSVLSYVSLGKIREY